MFRRFRILSQVLVIIFFLMGFGVNQVFAAMYGTGCYGTGVYTAGNQPCQPSGDSSGQGLSLPSSPSCTDQKPTSVPDLFQINGKTPTSLTLFFAPVLGNRDRYYISYSTNANSEEFGFEFMNDANGVISVDIQGLKANTVYYFKVRAGNGCQPGDWSNILAARTGQRVPTYRWSSLPSVISTAVRQRVQPSSVQRVNVDTSSSASPKVETPTIPEKTNNTEQQSTLSAPATLLQKVTRFIRGLFGK